MSHFTVLVIGDNPELQLLPFEESPEKGSKYLQFDDQHAEILEEYEHGTTKMVHLPDGRIVWPWESEFRVASPNNPFDGLRFSTQDKFEFPEGSVEKETPFKDYYKSFQQFAEDYHGFSDPEETTGHYGYWTNPNAKWDWYQIGGRWHGFFRLKEGTTGAKGSLGLMTKDKGPGYADQALKRDIDLSYMRREAAMKAREEYRKIAALFGGIIPRIKSWQSIREEYKDDIEKAREIYNSQPEVIKLRKSDMGPFVSLEDYPESEHIFAEIARNNVLTTFAVLKDGKWYERGEMGWWGIACNEKRDWDKEFAKLYDSLSEDILLTLMDCHI